MEVISPVTQSKNVQFERSISCDFLIKQYMMGYSIDVSKHFEGLQSITIQKCLDTGLRFYSPSNVDGDSVFYEQLQAIPWYYMDWKWENEVVLKLLSSTDKVLEIGCAKGAFIEKLQRSGIEATGLELNAEAVKFARNKGMEVFGETIQNHALKNKGVYDVVCSFQVMEHISDIKKVVNASVEVLKKGGRLIISVPNNNSFIKHNPNSILNMPPHHMCLWDEISLSNLQNFFPIKLEEFIFEPLQTYHYSIVWANGINSKIRSKFLAKVIIKISMLLQMHKLVSFNKKNIIGHSIIAIYTKN